MNKFKSYIGQLVLLTFLLASFSIVATPAILVVEAKLKSSPAFSGDNLALLSKGETVEIQQRKRGWYQIKRDNQQIGWITLLQVRFKAVEQTSGSSTISRLVSLRKGHSSVNATTGVRGIGEADIKNATANFAALEKVKEFQVGEFEARQFAKKIPLTTQKIEYKENRHEN